MLAPAILHAEGALSADWASRRIFLANVGVNAAHRLASPLYEDGSFVLVTIPEPATLSHRDGRGQGEGTHLLRYGDIPEFRGVVPQRYWPVPTHYDPEFETRTYGDNCGWAPRAAALRACRPGDCLFFIARLVGAPGPVFALVGLLEVEAIARDVRALPAGRFRANAHVRRAMADACWWDGFWVFAGTARSHLFERAAIVGRSEAELLFRDRAGAPWNWRTNRTELQTIGSYTRSCRCAIDPAREPERAAAFWRWLAGCVPSVERQVFG